MEAKLQQQAPQKVQGNKPNLTGIPTQMKLDFEQRSGLSFDDVRVHYNSDKPAQLQALAYTQGTQVYVGPGQERHLPHELGHVVQQKMGIVNFTGKINNVPINTSPDLESDADKLATSRNIYKEHHNVANHYGRIMPIQGYWNFWFEYNKLPGYQWYSTQDNRPEFETQIEVFFNNLMEDLYLPVRNSGMAKCHVIPISTISLLLNKHILRILNQPLSINQKKKYRMPVHYCLNFDTQSKERMEDLRRLVKMVMPLSSDLILERSVINIFEKVNGKKMDSTDYNNIAPMFLYYLEQYRITAQYQRNHANILLQQLEKMIFNNPEVDMVLLDSLVARLERLLNNAIENIRMGDSKTNSAIRGTIDPIFGTFDMNTDFISFNEDTDHAGMTKRLWKLSVLARNADLSASEAYNLCAPFFAIPGESQKEKTKSTMSEDGDSIQENITEDIPQRIVYTSDVAYGKSKSNSSLKIPIRIAHKQKARPNVEKTIYLESKEESELHDY